MSDEPLPLILVVDDDPRALGTTLKALSQGPYEIITAENGRAALGVLETRSPHLIILDIMMPEMDGYEVCTAIREDPRFEATPVLFLSGLDGSTDKARAFAAGGSDYLEKPAPLEVILSRVDRYLGQKDEAEEEADARGATPAPPRKSSRAAPAEFEAFREQLLNEAELDEDVRAAALEIEPTALYDLAPLLKVKESELAGRAAEACGYTYTKHVDPEELELGVLSPGFARSHLMVPLRMDGRRRVLVVTNPFDVETLFDLEATVYSRGSPEIVMAAPDTVRVLLGLEDELQDNQTQVRASPELAERIGGDPLDALGLSPEEDPPEAPESRHVIGEDHPTARLVQVILEEAVQLRASDIHLDPKGKEAELRCRIDGDMREVMRFPNEAGQMVISRLKALAGMDIAERRKPQDGGLQAFIDGRDFKLRLTTSFTPNGESLVIRLLEPSVDAVKLGDLGMTEGQRRDVTALANRTQGLIIVVGPTGCGKSTTIFSVLSSIDTQSRNLISVEDPVEYRIPFAKQQPVNEKAGVTFETLLRSAVRQDPDILFLGELRDSFSAKAAVDFAASGHLTITSLHSSNAVSSVFRLERLGVTRPNMAEGLIGVVAQRLVKRLCVECKEVRSINEEERSALEPFTDDVPSEVGAPVGCDVCGGLGYRGRVGVYEVLTFDSGLLERVRTGTPISELRKWVSDRGAYLISDHAVECVRLLNTSVDEAVEKVLVEEIPRTTESLAEAADPTVGGVSDGEDTVVEATVAGVPVLDGPPPAVSVPRILVVDDDADARNILNLYLTKSGYSVTLAEDGAEALVAIARQNFDLVLSDVHMPNLDGMKLLEILSLQGVHAPVVFLSADETLELVGLELGAVDYIRKPIQKETLLLRVARVLGGPTPPNRQGESAETPDV